MIVTFAHNVPLPKPFIMTFIPINIKPKASEQSTLIFMLVAYILFTCAKKGLKDGTVHFVSSTHYTHKRQVNPMSDGWWHIRTFSKICDQV